MGEREAYRELVLYLSCTGVLFMITSYSREIKRCTCTLTHDDIHAVNDELCAMPKFLTKIVNVL